MDILLAVSGGIDSMYMLHRASELFPEASFAVAHCNFGLRGEDSDADEQFVRQECVSLGIPFMTRHFDTVSEAASRGVSIEMAARDQRYAWFADICKGTAPELTGSGFSKFDAVATAHNANDSAETLLLNILRGCGTTGLRGIPSRRESDGVTILRPLLKIGREEITSWMTAGGHPWREDRTNSGTEFKRNKIRNLVFPVFKEINPSFIHTIGEDIGRFTQVDDIAEDYHRSALERISREDGSISAEGLLALKHWRYVLWRLVANCGFSQPTFEKLTALLEHYRVEPRGTVTIGGKTFQSPTHILTIKHKNLYISEKENSSTDGSRGKR